MGLKKKILYIVIILTLFFSSVEIIQRVRYSLRLKSVFWLLYGNRKFPDNYEQKQEKYIVKKLYNVDVIEASLLFYQSPCGRYKKYNPKFQVRGKINSYGFRGKEFSINKPKGVFRIVNLGGSTTYGTSVEDGFTYPEYLGKDLMLNTNKKFEVINAGIGGSTIYEIACLFKKEIIPLHPDIITINSVLNNFYFSDLAYKAPPPHPLSLQGINNFLLTKSVFYVTLREKLALLLKQEMVSIYRAPPKQAAKNFMNTESFWVDLEKSFKDIIYYAKLNNIKVLIIEEPIITSFFKNRNYVLLDKGIEPVYRRVASLLKKISIEEGVSLLETHDSFKNIPAEEYFTDGLHLTPKGNEFLANLIAEKIREMADENGR